MDEWLLHLKNNIVLLIFWWRFKSGWMSWIDLRKSLVLLSIVTNMIQMFVWVIEMLKIISVNLVWSVQRMIQLSIQWMIILVIWWWWLKTSWVRGIDLSQGFLWVACLIESLNSWSL